MAPATIPPEMHYDVRLASFYPSAGESSKNAASSSLLPFRPLTHPHLTPPALAAAGFRLVPTREEPDSCTCFLCGRTLNGWDEADDPFWEHWARRDGCAWASVVCGVKWGSEGAGRHGGEVIRYDTPDALPRSAKMVKARTATFGKAWPHKSKRGFLPAKPSALAEAGFVYTPTSEDKDCVTCMLCQHSVSAWEATDVPWDIHEKKHPGCPFFTAELGDPLRTLQQLQEAQASAAGRSAKAAGGDKKPTRSAKSKTAHPLTESQSSTDAQQAQPPSPAKAVPPSKTSKTRAPASRARGKRDTVVPTAAAPAAASESEKENDPPEPDQEVAQEPPRAAAAKSKGGKGKATRAGKGRKTVTPAPVEQESEVEEPSEREAVVPPAIGGVQGDDAQANEAGNDHDMEVDGAPAPVATKKGRASRAPRATTAKTTKGGKAAASKGKKGKAPATEEVESVPSATDADDPARTPRQQDGQSVHDEYIKQAAHDARAVLDSLGGTPSRRAPKPAMNKPAPPTSDENIADDDYIKQAALEARAVLDNLGAASSRRTTRAAPLKSVPLPPQPDASANDPFNATASTAQAPPPLPAEDMQLTEEQADMTVEEFLRYELGLRYEELKEQGERAIAEWVERSAKARDVIAGL